MKMENNILVKIANKFMYYKHKCYMLYYKKTLGDCGRNVYINKGVSLKNPSHINIGNDVILGKHVDLEAFCTFGRDCFNPTIQIGDYTSIWNYTHLSCVNGIYIGKGVLIGRFVLITDNSHGETTYSQVKQFYPGNRPLHSKGPVIIEDNVWIGDKVTILSGVRIGYGSIIGANSVVTKDIPPLCVAGGMPAKIIKRI